VIFGFATLFIPFNCVPKKQNKMMPAIQTQSFPTARKANSTVSQLEHFPENGEK
jgi:hypothetical protein